MKRRDFIKLGAGLGLAGLSAELGSLPARAQAATKFKASDVHPAGYPTVAAALDEGLIAEKLPEVEARAQAMLSA